VIRYFRRSVRLGKRHGSAALQKLASKMSENFNGHPHWHRRSFPRKSAMQYWRASGNVCAFYQAAQKVEKEWVLANGLEKLDFKFRECGFHLFDLGGDIVVKVVAFCHEHRQQTTLLVPVFNDLAGNLHQTRFGDLHETEIHSVLTHILPEISGHFLEGGNPIGVLTSVGD